MSGDAPQPGAEIGFGAESGEVTEGCDEGFLGEIIHFAEVVELAGEVASEHQFVLAHQVEEQIAFSPEDAGDEFSHGWGGISGVGHVSGQNVPLEAQSSQKNCDADQFDSRPTGGDPPGWPQSEVSTNVPSALPTRVSLLGEWLSTRVPDL